MGALYAVWTLIAVFLLEYFALSGGGVGAGTLAGVTAFAVIAAGGPGSVLAGAWADRLGRERVTIWAMAWMMGAPAAVVVAVALVWGFAVVADSAQFSTLITGVTPQHAVGTALTLQTSLGFGLTAVSNGLTVEVAGRFGWGPAFGLLALGPALGIVAMVRLAAARQRSVPPVHA